MRSTPSFFRTVLLYFTAITSACGHPVWSNTTPQITGVPSSTTPAESTMSTMGDAEQVSWRENGQQGGRHPSSLTIVSLDAGCRKRVFCEAARTLTERPNPPNAYFAAWSRGLSSQDCSHLYPDCSDSPAGLVLPLVNQAVGPKGFVGSFIERLTLPSGPDVPRELGAPRPSLVMQKLRQSQRQLEAGGWPPAHSDEFTPRND
ncbi:uncharacterized protein LOC144173240 [Haemaphysalis longicornis]